MAATITPLRIGDEGFLIASTIERCPKVMMVRELVKNGIEAAQRAPAGQRHLIIEAVDINGVAKLAIWNTGPGMNAEELFRMCDISSSIRKQQSLDQNFGIGAKVATLPSNTLGIRYRSCTGGRIHQVILGKRDGIYGRLLQSVPGSGEVSEIVDVTAQALADGRSSDYDWTEVVLYGHRPDQLTIMDPYDWEPEVKPGWILQALEERFYDIGDDVDITLSASVQPDGKPARFVPLKKRLSNRRNWEAVATDSNVYVTYVFSDPSAVPAIDNPAPVAALEGGIGIVYKDEVYDLRRGPWWLQMAPTFGIPFGAKYTTVLIELSDEFPSVPDIYRQFLRYRDGGQWQVEAQHFAPRVAKHRPTWLIDRLSSLAPDGSHTLLVRGEMTALLANLKVLRRWWPPGSKPSSEKGTSSESVPPGPPEYEVAPEIIALRDEQEVVERGFGDKACMFFQESHQIFINLRYPTVELMSDILGREFATESDTEAVRTQSLILAEQALTQRVSRMLVFALGKRDGWSRTDFEQAVSASSLTLAADDYLSSLPQARDIMRQRLTGFRQIAA